MNAQQRDSSEALGPRVFGQSYRAILIEEIVQGLGELRRPASGLLMSGFSAGLDIGFSVLLIATALTLLTGDVAPVLERLLVANFYAVGFILVVLGRSELFTEHTALAVFPVLAGRATVGGLARLWALVYVANVAGALLFAALLAFVGPRLEIIETAAFGDVAGPLLGFPWWLVLLSAVLAGWLMGLLSWLVAAGTDTLSRIVFVWLITASIGFAQLHHSIAGTVEVGSAMFAGEGVSPLEFGHFLLWSTAGNAIGGTILVALIKYGHVVRGAPTEEAADEVEADTRLGDGAIEVETDEVEQAARRAGAAPRRRRRRGG